MININTNTEHIKSFVTDVELSVYKDKVAKTFKTVYEKTGAG